MAGPNLTTHLPIVQVRSKVNTSPYTNALPELNGQTFPFGAPVQKTAAGYVQVWDGATVAAGILGVSESPGQNLGTSGLGAPTLPFGQITGTGTQQTYGTVPNQPLAVNIALGAPVADGRTLFMLANPDTIFAAQFDNAGGAVAADFTPTNADVGVSYGLTKSTGDGSWYIDKSKTAGNAVVRIESLDGLTGNQVNGTVFFTFLVSASQIP